MIAGVGVLPLAMGVGVLIGRSSAAKPSAAPAQVITVGSVPGAGSSTARAESFTDDWPAGTKGYTVQLQTLPQSGTTVSAVNAAKAAASAKGAKGVGVLKSEDFNSLEVRGQLLGHEHVGTLGDLQHAGDRVVIGDRDEVHAAALGQRVDLLGRGRALGQPDRALHAQARLLRGGRVAVHIRARRLASLTQRSHVFHTHTDFSAKSDLL